MLRYGEVSVVRTFNIATRHDSIVYGISEGTVLLIAFYLSIIGLIPPTVCRAMPLYICTVLIYKNVLPSEPFHYLMIPR